MKKLLRVRIALIGVLIGGAALGGAAVSGALGSIGEASGSPSVGRIPNAAFSGGHLNATLVPGYVPALNQQGSVVGYVRKTDILAPAPNSAGVVVSPAPASTEPIPVYASTLDKVVGHMVPGVGYVALGELPSSELHMPITITTTPSTGS